MNPFLMRLMAQLGPRATSLFGAGPGLMTRFGMFNAPEVEGVQPVNSQASPSVSPPISTSNYAPPPSPNERVASAFGDLGPAMVADVPLPQPRPNPGPPYQSAYTHGNPFPMPRARPDDAPARQDMPFWQRNAFMQTDPLSGQFLNPDMAAQAQKQMPDLMGKFAKYFTA